MNTNIDVVWVDNANSDVHRAGKAAESVEIGLPEVFFTRSKGGHGRSKLDPAFEEESWLQARKSPAHTSIRSPSIW